MTSEQTFVIVGASLAGTKAAETLRAEGFGGREKVYVHDEGFYTENAIELRLERTAVRLDTASRELALNDGERLGYDRLLLALNQGPAAARSMLGRAAGYDLAPYFFSDQYDVWDVSDAIQRLIRVRVPVDDRRLADPDVALEELARVGGGTAA